MAVEKKLEVQIVGKDKLTPVLKNAEKATSTFSKALAVLGTVGKFALAGIAIAAAGLALAFAGIIAWVKKCIAAFTAYASKVDDVQDVLGGTAENASRLVGQFRLTNVEVGAATNGMKFFAKNVDAAQQGQKAMMTTFTRLGIAIKDHNGELRDADTIMLEVRDALSRMRDGAAKTGIAMKLFGRGGAALMDWLEKSPAYIREVNRRLTKLGLILGEDSLLAMRKYRRAQANMTLAWDAFKIAAGKALIPIVTKYLAQLANWFTNNMPVIRAYIHRFAAAFKTVVDRILELVQKYFPLVKAWVETNVPKIVSRVQNIASAFMGVARWLDTVLSRLGRLWELIIRIKNIGSFTHTIGFSIPGLSQLNQLKSVLGLQQGGIVTRPTLAVVGERGPEAVIPLNKGTGRGVTVTLQNCTLVGSGHDAGRAIARVLDDYYRRKSRGA